MSLFDRRTDTERELDAYRQNNSSNERRNPFDTQNTANGNNSGTQSNPYDYGNTNYNNSINRQQNPFDTQNTANGNNSGTQSNPYDYGNTNYNNSINRQQNPFDTQNTANGNNSGTQSNPYDYGNTNYNNSINRQQNPFDTQNTANGNNNRTQSNPYDYGNTNYNNSINRQQNPFDTQNAANGNNNGTQSNPYDYGNTNYNNSINRQQNPFDTQNAANSSQNGVKPNTYGDNNINNIELNSNNNNNNGQSSCAMSILFLIWFVGSMIAFAIFGGTGQTGLGLVMFGQVFLVMGIVVCSKIKKEKGKPIGMEFLLWLFPIVGAGTIIGGMINAFGDSLFIERFNKNVVPVAFCLIFVLVGLGVLIFPMVKRKKDRERCTVRIDADIINVKSTITVNNKNRRRRVYAPVYRYYYQGKVYENSSTLYTGYKITVNTKGEIYINPSDANDFIEPNRERYGLVVMNILGIVFTVMGLVAILTILFN